MCLCDFSFCVLLCCFLDSWRVREPHVCAVGANSQDCHFMESRRVHSASPSSFSTVQSTPSRTVVVVVVVLMLWMVVVVVVVVEN